MENKKPTEKKKDIEKVRAEMSKKVMEMNRKGNSKGNTVFSFGLGRNPLIVLVVSILLIFFVLQLLNRGVGAGKIGITDTINGIKENRFSQFIVQNDGSVQVYGKQYMVVNKAETLQDVLKDSTEYKFTDSRVGDIEEINLDRLIAELSDGDLASQLRSALSRGGNGITEIVIADNFILALRTGAQVDYIVRGANEQDLQSRLEARNLSLATIPQKVSKLKYLAKSVDNNAFVDNLNNNAFSNVIYLEENGIALAKLKTSSTFRASIDWTPVISSFTTLLQQEDINLSSTNFELITQNIGQGISFSDVLTVIALVGFGVIAFMLFRGMQGGGGMGIAQFGQSKAKLFFGSKIDTTFKDVAGIDEARDELNEVVDFLRNPAKFRKLGARIPKGILMVGAPGTGKTLLARAIAGEAGVPFFHTSGSEFEEMLVGAGASRVRDLFTKAKKAAPALIFIDEIDAVARKRGTKVQSGTTEQTLNQILVEMDGFEKNVNVIVLAATNRPDVLDPAILRPGRFDRQIRIELPDMQGRKEILAVHGENKPFDETVDLERVAKRTVGFTGADLENILNEAAIIAAKEGKSKISDDDIDESISKVVLGPAKKSRKRTDAELSLVAYHEAGHAVVAKMIPEATPVDRISIISRGSSGGVTMFLPEKDEYIVSKRKLLAEIAVSLGGRAAEEIALDDISTGASSDIEKATNVAKRMIQRFGMSEKMGLVQYGDFEENDYLGYAYSSSKEYSDKTAQDIDMEVKQLVTDAYERAKKILNDNRATLDKVAKELLEKEVLGKEEFEKLF
jgi:cell division protease FtsH